jgi:hypothetical protein
MWLNINPIRYHQNIAHLDDVGVAKLRQQRDLLQASVPLLLGHLKDL